MEIKICYIVGAGEFEGDTFSPDPQDYVIAADGGYAYLQQLHISPDLVVGDFDSLGTVPENETIIKHPVMKDDTDMMLAVKEGFQRGYKTFVIYGGLGGRIDHAIANIQTLAYISHHGGIGFLSGNHQMITLITNTSISFDKSVGGIISVFSNSSCAHGVDLEGLLYPLENATLTSNYPLGVSNEFTGREATVRVKDGSLIVMWSGDFDKAVLRW
ncbi:MAG: thiamine diphosphokinase [Oscillospiraceae bacterium]